MTDASELMKAILVNMVQEFHWNHLIITGILRDKI